MNTIFYKFFLVASFLSFPIVSIAGNKDRTGQAGATELLINPWANSTGVFGMNTPHVRGVEAMKSNIAGLATVRNTEIGLAQNTYLSSSGVNVANLGLAQKLGNLGVIGFNIQSTSFGDIQITTPDNPQGGVGTYKPQFLNFTLGFAKKFENNIQAGFAGTFVSEQITNIRASGACFEAGVQYITGKRDNFHVGVTLRNIGTNMRFSGNGFSIIADAPSNATYQLNRNTPTEKFEMPTYLNFGASYDFYLDANRLQSEEDLPKHRLTAMATFTSNSFLSDYIGGGLEYSFKELFMLRGAYRYEDGIASADTRNTFFTGLSAGATIQKALGDRGPILAIDYSYRPTVRPNNGVHAFSLRIMTRSIKDAVADEQ